MSDLLNRQDAIEAFWKLDIELRPSAIDAITDMLKTLPSAEPERKKGKWIDTGSGQECSECHEIQYGYDSFRYFCAFCGADMRGHHSKRLRLMSGADMKEGDRNEI